MADSVKRKLAIAIKYNKESMVAPKVVAKGKGVVAERVIEIAKQNGVPIVENELLMEALEKLSLNQDIPPALYQAVAEILVTIYKSEAKFKKS